MQRSDRACMKISYRCGGHTATGQGQAEMSAFVSSKERCDFSLRMTKKQKSEKSRKNLTNAEKLRVSEIPMI